jgi:hypothetical protein
MDEEIIDIQDDKQDKRPWMYILGVFLILILLVSFFPFYNMKFDPRPHHIPSIAEIGITSDDLSTETVKLRTDLDFLEFVTPADPFVKNTANKISSIACDGERVCHAKAIYYFVRDNFDYISDPVDFEYVEKPQDFMFSGGGDCESGTLFMANLMEAVGIDSQIVFVPGHAFLRIKVPEASQRYQRDTWIYLDWTCKDCGFGEIPRTSWELPHKYLEVN